MGAKLVLVAIGKLRHASLLPLCDMRVPERTLMGGRHLNFPSNIQEGNYATDI
jgi:hypothetical protein